MLTTRITAMAAASAAVIAVTAAASAAPAWAAGGTSKASGCSAYRSGGGWGVHCQSGSGPASTGSGGGGHQKCTWTPDVSQYWPGFTQNAPKAPKGYVYLVELCGKTFSTPQLVATGRGGPTPAELAQQAYSHLQPPQPRVRTTPPRGTNGNVGAAEWFWVPRGQWQPLARRAQAGQVWAQVTATPSKLVFRPGGGLTAVTCPGPGTAYDTSVPAGSQHTDCSYTYTRSSRGQPQNTYTASVTVTWNATWHGSGGTGGALPALTTTTTFALPVGDAPAIIPDGG